VQIIKYRIFFEKTTDEIMNYFFYRTNIGIVTICANYNAIIGLIFGEHNAGQKLETDLIKKAYEQLMEYLSGFRKQFDLNLEYNGTGFQMRVWNELKKIPYGEVRTYGKVAHALDNPKAYRSVGRACNKNPVPIFIPCHRVIGATGNLVGYGGGISIKQKLLALEKNYAASI
jgi:methylated-DNA-[protein]-cysteine S-methyltransferase